MNKIIGKVAKSDGEIVGYETPLVKSFRDEIEVLKERFRVGLGEETHMHFNILDSRPFDGSRDAKALENFIWDLERYFKIARVHDNNKQQTCD